MMIYLKRIAFILTLLFLFSFSIEKKKTQEVTVNELKKHVSYLASDELKGRLTGSNGDSLAAEYIRGELKKSGLKPLYDNGFQHFRVTDKIVTGPDNNLVIKGASLNLLYQYSKFDTLKFRIWHLSFCVLII